MSYEVSSHEILEAEAMHIIREAHAQFARPVLLFSGGKDSITVLRLAAKAFWPAPLPFPVLHVDTGHNFPEVLEFRDRSVRRLGATLIVASVEATIAAGRAPADGGSRNRLQSRTLLDALAQHGFDAAIGGARRDEERSRAKERIFSIRDCAGRWHPHRQRPEVWALYNGRLAAGEHARVFPLSDWTELDVWRYVAAERLDLPSLYFAHRRTVFERDGMLYAPCPSMWPAAGEDPIETFVRYRTVGDMSCTGAVRSTAATVEEVIREISATRVTERGQTRADDRTSDAAMEDRKREGYF